MSLLLPLPPPPPPPPPPQLASQGCELDVVDGDGHCPLHKAVMYGQLEAVQVLAMNGADLNIKDALGNTAIHVSCGGGEGLWVGLRGGDGFKKFPLALQMAAYGGSNAILTTLLSQSANPNLQVRKSFP